MDEFKAFFSKWIAPETVDRIIIISFAIIIIFILVYLVKRMIVKHIQDIDKRYHARKVSNILGYVLLFLVGIFLYREKLGNIGVAMGLAGAGIAFALSEVITSFAGWISIMFTNQIRVGERVKIGDLKGDIIDIQVFKTTIMEVGDWIDGDLYNGRITTLSNSFVYKVPIQNYSGDYPFVWDEIKIPLRLASDFKLAKEVFTEVTNEICGSYAEHSKTVWTAMQNKYRIENAKVDPMITLEFDQSWITFTIRYIVDYTQRRTTKDQLYTRILEEIRKRETSLMIATSAMEVTTIRGDHDQA